MKGLIFDVDGVLADTETLIAQATIKMFRELCNVNMQPEDFQPFVGTGAIRYVEGPAEKYGIAINTERAVALREENIIALLNSGVSIGFPGVNELVMAAADDPEWVLGIATSSSRENSQATLRAADVPIGLFKAYVTGDKVTHRKPHPEIYRTAAEALELPPSSCVAVEDAPAGVASAKAAGMKCVAVTNSVPGEALGEADLIVDSLVEVTLAGLQDLAT